MKFKRQSKIIELIKRHDIETQDDLAEKLKKAGFDVTQATVSRDIKDMKLSKVLTKDGKNKYTVLASNSTDSLSERFVSIFREAVLSIDYAKNMVVLKTLDGMAMAVAASIDAMDHYQTLGCIAGDNTIFCVVKTEEIAIELVETFQNIIRAD